MRKTAFLVLALSLTLRAQTKIDLAKQATNADFSGYPATKPMKSGTTLPASCGTGEMFFKSDATPGQNVYVCVSNTWYLLAGITSVNWGDIGGTLSAQTDLNSALSGKAASSHSHATADLTTKTGSGSYVVTTTGIPSDGCAEWASGELGSSGTPCGTGAGTVSSVASASQSFTGQTSVTITHNFNSLSQIVACYDGSAQWIQPASITTGLSTTTVTFSGAQTGSCIDLGGTGLYSQSFTGQTSVSLTHSLGTQAIIVSCYDGSNQVIEPNSIVATSTSAATVTFTTAQTGSCVVAASLALAGGGGAGTVTSVGLAVPTGFSISGSPITGAGTLTIGTTLDGILRGTGSGFTTAAYSNIVALWASGACSGYLKSDGTCDTPAGGSTYTAGDGISIASNVISVDATVPAVAVSGSQSLTFGTIAQSSCVTQNITATGATVGDSVAPGYPATLPDGLMGMMFVSATNTIQVRLCKITAGSADVTGLTFTYQIIRGR